MKDKLTSFGDYPKTLGSISSLTSFSSGDSDSKPVTKLQAFGKNLPVYKRGLGDIPLLITGPANLFKKLGMLPQALDNVFTIYFVDLFEKTQDFTMDFTHIGLADFTSELESIRKQLELDKIALFGHSATGVLALEYMEKYKDKVLLNILVGMAPIWGEYKNNLVNKYFLENSDAGRQRLFSSDQESKDNKQSANIPFVVNYNARRAHFYYEPQLSVWKTLWDDLCLDEDLVNHYFTLIRNYDIRKGFNNSGTPIFLGLGLYDYSCPFYGWTDDAQKQLAGMEYYIFENSGHYPQVEQAELFCEKLLEYMRAVKLLPLQSMPIRNLK